ncbi:GGDEF domain-containing protein [Patescibacteria group bacterium]|nr:GGDEF domain-containing protein [Patescibacteria group bacterium]MBU1612972.1 GGDEF domain-containing protein [Patescibacteria group bacterium]
MKNIRSHAERLGLDENFNLKQIKGTGNPELRQMIEAPADFYVPPSPEEWREIEPNRDRLEKIQIEFKKLIDKDVVTSALGAHEQVMEEKMAKELNIDIELLEKIRSLLLENKEIATVENSLKLEEGTIEKIINYVGSQEYIIKFIKQQIDIKRDQLVEQAVNNINAQEKEMSDPLTGALNIIGIQNHFLKEMEKLKNDKSGKSSVVIANFDIDSFKRVNDEFGHLMGDRLIKDIIMALKGQKTEVTGLRSSDGIGRAGGDEFVVIAFLDQNIVQNAESVFIEKIKNILNSVAGDYGKVSITGGYSIITKDNKLTYEEASQQADEAAIFEKIRKPGDFLRYSPNLKPDLTTIESRRRWATEWVERQFKRRQGELEVELNAEKNPKQRTSIEKRIKLLEKQKTIAIEEKALELEQGLKKTN